MDLHKFIAETRKISEGDLYKESEEGQEFEKAPAPDIAAFPALRTPPPLPFPSVPLPLDWLGQTEVKWREEQTWWRGNRG